LGVLAIWALWFALSEDFGSADSSLLGFIFLGLLVAVVPAGLLIGLALVTGPLLLNWKRQL
jgi:hypothetical protein